jgi:hypothetical protein
MMYPLGRGFRRRRFRLRRWCRSRVLGFDGLGLGTLDGLVYDGLRALDGLVLVFDRIGRLGMLYVQNPQQRRHVRILLRDVGSIRRLQKIVESLLQGTLRVEAFERITGRRSVFENLVAQNTFRPFRLQEADPGRSVDGKVDPSVVPTVLRAPRQTRTHLSLQVPESDLGELVLDLSFGLHSTSRYRISAKET